DLEDLVAARLEVRFHQVGHFAGGRDVDLVERDQAGAGDQFGAGRVAVGGQFLLDRGQVGDRIAARLLGRAVEHVDQGGAPLHVPQEIVPQAPAPAGAGDQARDVGQDELDGAGTYQTEGRDQGGK